MDTQQFRELLLHHHANHGPIIIRHSGRYHIIPHDRYKVIDDPIYPYIEFCCEEGNRKIMYSKNDMNKYLWLVDSPESRRLKTREQALGKEENIMSKPDVIVGIVAMPSKKVQATKIVADYIRKRVTVLFSDGGKEVVDCHQEDEFDVVIGYSIAVTRHMAGSSGAVRRDINSVLLEVKPKFKKGETEKATNPVAPRKKPAAKKTAKKSPAKKK